MRPQHLSDEAVAAYADGVLARHARERAGRHIAECPECAHAVRVQREAAFALRAASAPALPTGLLDRLRTVPIDTPITVPPTVFADDGSPMISTFAPMAALVPTEPQRRVQHPFLATAAAVAIAGALTTGVVMSESSAGAPAHPAPTAPSVRTVPLTTWFTGVSR